MYIDIGNPIQRTESAYDFPLLIKQLWITPRPMSFWSITNSCPCWPAFVTS